MKVYTRADFENMNKRELIKKIISRYAKIRKFQLLIDFEVIDHITILSTLDVVLSVATSPITIPAMTAYYMRKDKSELVDICWKAQETLEKIRKDIMSKAILIKNIRLLLFKIAYYKENIEVDLVPIYAHSKDVNSQDLLEHNRLKQYSKEELFNILKKLRTELYKIRAEQQAIPNAKKSKFSNTLPMTQKQIAIAREHISKSRDAWIKTVLDMENKWHQNEQVKTLMSRLVTVKNDLETCSRNIYKISKQEIERQFWNVIPRNGFYVDDNDLSKKFLNIIIDISSQPIKLNSDQLQVIDEFGLYYGINILNSVISKCEFIMNNVASNDISKYLKDNQLTTDAGNIKHILSGHSIKIPEDFIDPLTFDLMLDPVITPAKQVYDRVELIKWLKEKKTDPNTRRETEIDELRSDKDKREKILQFLKEFVAKSELKASASADSGNSKKSSPR